MITSSGVPSEVYLLHKGEYVIANQLIGKSGSTGNSMGPHISFEVQLDKTEEEDVD